jgi:hypothetical protein
MDAAGNHVAEAGGKWFRNSNIIWKVNWETYGTRDAVVVKAYDLFNIE